MALNKTKVVVHYQIFEISTEGHLTIGRYGYYEQNFAYDRFDSVEEAVGYLDGMSDEIGFNHEYIILPVATKEWDNED